MVILREMSLLMDRLRMFPHSNRKFHFFSPHIASNVARRIHPLVFAQCTMHIARTIHEDCRAQNAEIRLLQFSHQIERVKIGENVRNSKKNVRNSKNQVKCSIQRNVWIQRKMVRFKWKFYEKRMKNAKSRHKSNFHHKMEDRISFIKMMRFIHIWFSCIFHEL